MSRAFTILEFIFIIVIISVVAAVAIPKILNNTTNTYIVKAKSDIALIRKAIIKEHHYQIQKQTGIDYIDSLDSAANDTAKQSIFNGIDGRELLEYPLISTSNTKLEEGKWIKLSSNEYEIVLSKDIKVLFTYDNSNGRFECDSDEEYCMELMQ